MKTQDERIADLEREVAELKAMMPRFTFTDVTGNLPADFVLAGSVNVSDVVRQIEAEMYEPIARVEVAK